MSLPLGLEVSMGSVALFRATPRPEPVVGVDGDQERPAEPVQAVDEDRGELARLGVLQEPPAFRPLV